MPETTINGLADKQAWLKAHRGVLNGIAKRLKISRQQVRMVFWEHRESQRIEALLREAGAPMGDRAK